MEDAVETSAMRKIYWRLLPLAVVSYLLAYIDRINVSFAGLTMRDDLAMSATPTCWCRTTCRRSTVATRRVSPSPIATATSRR